MSDKENKTKETLYLTVHLVGGEGVITSDPEEFDISSFKYQKQKKLLDETLLELRRLNALRLEIKGQKVYINPDKILWVEVTIK